MTLKSSFLFLLLFPMAILANAQKYDAEIIKYSTSCEVEANRISEIDSVTILINNRLGDKYTEISIPYSKIEKLSDLDAWIENTEGVTVRKLKKSEIVDKSAISDISLYADNFEKCFQLKHNIYPYKIVYTYKTTYSEYITITRWTPVIYRDIPTHNAFLRIVVPKDFSYHQYLNNIAEAKVDTLKSGIVLKWNSSYLKPLKQEIYSKPENSIPTVMVWPASFKYGAVGSLNSWESYGNWQYRLIRGLDVLPEKEKQTVSELIKGISDKKEIVKILYHYLQDQTHYIDVTIGIGGLKPYPASYVAQNKYGDCKALSNYMKALLSYAGIASIYANVYRSEQQRDIIKNFTGPQFNHAVLAVPIDNDTIWLENTSNTYPYGFMGTTTQNKQALLICEKNSRLVRIPEMKKEDNLVSYKLEFDLYTNGQAKVTLNNSFKGLDFEEFIHLHSDFNDAQKERIIREYMPFENYEVVNWNLKKLNRDTARIELQASLNLYKYLKPLGGEYYFSLYPTRIPSFQLAAERTLPVAIPVPIYVSDTLIYNLPIGYKLKTMPDPVNLKSIFGCYKLNLNVKEGKIKAFKSFELFQGEYKIGQYPEFYAFIKSVKDKELLKLIIQPIN
jgi:hypothetical protein